MAELLKKYSDFNNPFSLVFIKNKNLFNENILVSNISIELTIESKVSYFQIHVDAFEPETGKFYTEWLDEYFNLGNDVEIKLGYQNTTITVIKGLITNVEFNCNNTNGEIIIHGMDDSFKLMLATKEAKVWNAKSITEIADKILSQYGSLSKSIDSSNDDTKKSGDKWMILQNNESDFQFLRRLAEEFCFEFYVQNKKVYFKKRDYTQPTITLLYGETIINFSMQQNAPGMYSKVTVSAMDDKKDPVTAFADSGEVNAFGDGSKTGGDIVKKIANAELKVYDSRVKSKDDAQKTAQRLINKTALNFITGSCETIGIPDIVPGKYVKIAGIGKGIDNTYYVTEVTHNFGESGYTTSFEFRGNKI